MKRFTDIFRRKSVVLLFVDLIQDLDLIVPIAIGLQQRKELTIKVVVTDRGLAKSPRIRSTFAELGITVTPVVYKSVFKGNQPSLKGIHALITASETTAGPHRAAHALTKRANKAGIATYTLQHGYENIGLTYSDSTYPLSDITFASQTVFIWGHHSHLLDDISAETRNKCVSVGCPKKARPFNTLPTLEHSGSHLVAIFENLHWERYSQQYRQQALDDIATAVHNFPDITFLVKPHPAGLWLTKQEQDLLPPAQNLIVINPQDKKWQAFTAPALAEIADAVISTPSTVVLDATRLNTPVAVIGYDLSLPMYSPLPILKETSDWNTFIEDICGISGGVSGLDKLKQITQAFTKEALIEGDGVSRILDRVLLDISR